MYGNKLFHSSSITDFLRDWENQLKNEIDSLDLVDLQDISIHDKMINKFLVVLPEINEDKKTIKHREIKKESVGYFGDQILTNAIEIEISIPIEGNSELMYFEPSTRELNSIDGEVQNQDLVLTFINAGNDQAQFKSEYQNLLNSIKRHLQWLSEDIKKFNDNLPNKIDVLLKNRLDLVNKNKNFIDSLDI